MAKYDDASWHYGGEFPDDLPDECGATHIGMFLTWCIDNDLISDFQIEESKEDIDKVKKRKLTGAKFLIENCDGTFTDEDLNEVGNQFAENYFESDTNFGKKFANYFDDYTYVFEQKAKTDDFEYETIYHIADTLENYLLIKPLIDKRFEQWKQI